MPTDTMLENRLPSHGTAELFGWPQGSPATLGAWRVAYFWRHFPDGFRPIVNRGETVVLHCFVFLLPVVTGPGTPAVPRR